VHGLGHFVELEVVLTEDQTTAAGQAIAENWMRQLEIAPAALLCDAYIDLLEAAPPRLPSMTRP
jgi:adenylate cyclase class IV